MANLNMGGGTDVQEIKIQNRLMRQTVKYLSPMTTMVQIISNRGVARATVCFSVVVIYLSLLGCSPGSEDPPYPTSIDTGLNNFLEKMAKLGAKAYSGKSYRYVLITKCNLLVTKQFNQHPIRQTEVNLSKATFESRSYAGDIGFEVRVANLPDKPDILEANSAESTDSMLQYLQILSENCKANPS